MSVDVKHLTLCSFDFNNEVISSNIKSQPAAAVANSFVDELHNAMNTKPGKVFAVFNQEGLGVELASLALDSAPLSGAIEKVLQKLLTQMNEYRICDMGHLVIADYTYLACRYLYISVMNKSSNFTLDSEQQIMTQSFLDKSKYIVSVRINLSELSDENSKSPPITIAKKMAARSALNMLLESLECEVHSSTKEESRKLLTHIEEYFNEGGRDESDIAHHRKEAERYCKTQASSGQPVSIEQLGEVIGPQNGDFKSFIEQARGEVIEEVMVEPSMMRTLSQFKGSGGGISMQFDHKLLGERVHYDPSTDTLTLKGTPPNLRDQLQRHLMNEQTRKSESEIKKSA